MAFEGDDVNDSTKDTRPVKTKQITSDSSPRTSGNIDDAEAAAAAAVAAAVEPERLNWDNPIEFLLSCVSLSVGLGNIWRFPFTAYENGGGAFLIPYLIVLIFIGRPLYFMEMILGQFSSYGSVKIWKCVPIAKGKLLSAVSSARTRTVLKNTSWDYVYRRRII